MPATPPLKSLCVITASPGSNEPVFIMVDEPACGVTLTVAITGAFVALVAVNEGIFPAPVGASPIDAVLLVQLNKVPATDPAKFTAAVSVLLHTTWLAGWVTSGVGCTVTVAVIEAPVQVPETGVIVNVTITGDEVVLVNVPLIFPEPLAGIPVTEPVIFLVQL